MSKHVNIPIFIPHLGCPHHCVFCDQKKITGQQGEVTLSQAEEIIEKHLATIRLPREQIEIAYFGGQLYRYSHRKAGGLSFACQPLSG